LKIVWTQLWTVCLLHLAIPQLHIHQPPSRTQTADRYNTHLLRSTLLLPSITHICCAQLYFSLNFILNTTLPACRHTQVGCQQTSSQHYQIGSFVPARPWPGPVGGAVSWEAAHCSHAESCRRPHACHVQLYSN
jgi:hypothetical protein